MRTLRVLVLGSIFCGGVACVPIDEVLDRVTLSEAELQDVADNYNGAIAAYHDLESFAAEIASGEVDLSGADFVAPDASNGWTGTLNFVSDAFPGGHGELTATFRVLEGGVPVNPFETDPESGAPLTLDLVLRFRGVTAQGAPLALDADFTSLYDVSDPVQGVITTNGSFRIGHNDYVANLEATGFAVRYVRATGLPESASGRIMGVLDIPDFAFNADIDVEGQGPVVQIDVRVLDQVVDSGTLPISDF